MPVGLYIVRPSSALARGAIVVACPPIEAKRVGLRYGYLAPARGFIPQSRCAGGSAPFLKYVIALAGDVVELNERGLQINGKLVDAHKVARVDRDGRALKAMPHGSYRLGGDEIWLYSPAAASWDSRYFGPASCGIFSTAVPLWTTNPTPVARLFDLHN